MGPEALLTWAGDDGNTFDILQRVGVPMILGVVMPTAVLGPDPTAIREYALTAQELRITSPQVPSWEENQAMLDSPSTQRIALR